MQDGVTYDVLSENEFSNMAIQTTTTIPQIASGIVTTTTQTTSSHGIQYALPQKNEIKVVVRSLTAGEIAMATQVFKDAIDYSKVRVHAETYIPFQDEDTAVTPNGEIYFHPKRFKDDFSQEANSEKHWLIHEMTHVWQYQLGYPVAGRGFFRVGLSYEYDLAEDKLLKDYNMEAQGDLIADYFALKFLKDAGAMKRNQQRYAGDLPLYEKVLRVFLSDPKDPGNQPGGIFLKRFHNE